MPFALCKTIQVHPCESMANFSVEVAFAIRNAFFYSLFPVVSTMLFALCALLDHPWLTQLLKLFSQFAIVPTQSSIYHEVKLSSNQRMNKDVYQIPWQPIQKRIVTLQYRYDGFDTGCS